MHDPKCLSEVLEHNKEVLIIDLLDHVTCVEDHYLKALVEPTKGIYITGSIEPFIKETGPYFMRELFPSPKGEVSYLDILSTKSDILDSSGTQVISGKDLVLKRKFLSLKPSIPVVAMKAALAVVDDYVTSVCRKANRNRTYNLYNLVKPEFHSTIVAKDEFMHVFERLLDQVMKFIGDDTWNIYFIKVKGTSLIIEKSVDWRIYRYYEMTFKEQENKEE
jgi:hypothetical protein